MKRVAVLGIPGAGKSTLSRRLGERLGLPVHHLDQYFWNPGWKASTREVFNDTVRRLLEQDEWILDGNYRQTIPLRLEFADTAVFLDPPRRVAFQRVFKRVLTYRNGGRPDMTEGCPERFLDGEFLRYIWRFHRDVHPEVTGYLQEFAERGGTVIRLTNDREAERWLESIELKPDKRFG
jgi:adenylate kinase family enzyme